jgi:kynurenine formamidase
MGKTLSNWGRWGADDEIGTLNLIDADAIRRGAALAKTGKAFTLGVSFGEEGPQTGDLIGRFNPHHYMTAIGAGWGDPPGFQYSDDVLVLPLQAATQWDSLAHVHYDGQLYNGYPADEALGTSGALRDGIDKQAAHAYLTKGVLLDIARLKGVERIAPNTLITPEDLDAAVARQRVSIEPGDVLLLRTGHINTFLEDGDRATFNWQPPGIGLQTMPWLRERDIAAICSDTTNVEVMPGEDPQLVSPCHLVAIRDMGMPFGEIFNLEELASDCADDGVWEFLFCAQPLKVTNGIGSPINPLAVK